MVAQGCHASLGAALKAMRSKSSWFENWQKQGGKKIVCKISSEKDLVKYYRDAIDLGLPCSIINDAGHTQLPPGTTTAVGIGPAPEQTVDTITAELKLL